MASIPLTVTLGVNDRLLSAWRGLNEHLDPLLWYVLSCGLQLKELFVLISSPDSFNSTLKCMSQTFDGNQIGRLRRLRHQKGVVEEPFGEQLRFEFRVVFLLKMEATANATAKNGQITVSMMMRYILESIGISESTLDVVKGSNSVATEAVVNHHRAFATLHGRQLTTWMVCGTERTSHKLDSVRPAQQKVRFLAPDQLMPLLNGPVLVSMSPIETCFATLGGHQWYLC
uniref:Uncharacterized protein n=1 Tax=Haemonchus contortus TaxID=6289 RepID=A0A7I4Z3A9_HAECO